MLIAPVLQHSAYPRNSWLLFLWLILVSAGPSVARTTSTAPAPANALPKLATVLNPDGTLRVGADGSFNPAGYCMATAANGKPAFHPTSTAGVGDEKWQNGFNLPGTNGTVYALAVSGTNVYAAGVSANRIAKWNGSA